MLKSTPPAPVIWPESSNVLFGKRSVMLDVAFRVMVPVNLTKVPAGLFAPSAPFVEDPLSVMLLAMVRLLVSTDKTAPAATDTLPAPSADALLTEIVPALIVVPPA